MPYGNISNSKTFNYNKRFSFSSSSPLDAYKDNLVMGFSYYKLITIYKGYCVKVRRDSDNAIQDFGFIDGYIDKVGILAFCGTSSGYVHTWYNQYASGNNQVQTTNNLQPKIVTSGVFENDGILFVSANSNCMNALIYAAVDLLIPQISYYTNFKPASGTGYVWLVCNDVGVQQFGLADNSAVSTFYINSSGANLTQNTTSQNKTLFNWVGTGANQTTRNVNNTEVVYTYATSPITSYDYITLASRKNGVSSNAAFFNGNLKTVVVFNTTTEYNIVSNV